MFKCALRLAAILAVVAPAALCQAKINLDSKKVTYMLPTGIFVPQGQTITINATGTLTLTDPGGSGFFTVDAIGVIQTVTNENTDKSFFDFLRDVALPPLEPPSPGKLKFPPGGTGATLIGAYGALVLGLSPNQCGATSNADFPNGFINPGTGAGPIPISGGYIYLGVQRDNEVAVTGTYAVSISLSGSPTPPLGCNAGVQALDPYATLMLPQSSTITTNAAVLATGGRVVTGVAADGVTQLVIRAQGFDPSHLIVIAIGDDTGNVAPVNGEDGTLSGGAAVSATTVIPAVQNVNGINYAFATYHSPIDYARSSGLDNGTPSRKIGFALFDVTSNTVLGVAAVDLLRPPVFFIHGLWGDPGTWNEFALALQGGIRGINMFRADFQKTNGDGVRDNTGTVLMQAYRALDAFRARNQAAASQLDFVVHSMGGLISDTMPTFPAFKLPANYGQGLIHKLITVDTPYEGSQLAVGVSGANSACKNLLKLSGHNPGNAIRDLIPTSDFLHNFDPSPPDFPKHAIASIVTPEQETEANTVVNAIFGPLNLVPAGRGTANAFCSQIFSAGSSAPPPGFSFSRYYLTVDDVLYNGANDIIVSEKSQLSHYLPGLTADITTGLAHSHFVDGVIAPVGIPGSLDLGIGSPTSNPTVVLNLLNSSVSPITSGAFLH